METKETRQFIHLVVPHWTWNQREDTLEQLVSSDSGLQI